ncbi:MAG: 16S rRNA (adenine(1518)-N(6)/adenine(1519)-N(6))-dimethyltransferase, partial [Bacteroidia bacterium]|nr:16S rRNA (adenine(1518)-N(6)/adenine(1519)-N(6))-dimethyltransferase [Bacteroidia bacterium]
MKAKKHLGQHFLKDNQVIYRIVSLIDQHCKKDTPLLEVGPGQGILTEQLYLEYSDFKAVEFDEDMVNILRTFVHPSRIIHKDFLRLDPRDVFNG